MTTFTRGPRASAALDDGSDIVSDRLIGCAAIAEYWFGRSDWPTRKTTFALLTRGQIPGGKMGGRWVASRRALRRKHEQLTGLTDDVEPAEAAE